MAKNKKISPEEIPNMIEEVLPVLQKKITELQTKDKVSDAEAKLCLSIIQSLNMAYYQFRVLKREIKDETKAIIQSTNDKLFSIKSINS